MNLVVIESQGKGQQSILSRYTNRKFDSRAQGNLDDYPRAEILEMVEAFRVNGVEADESFDPTI